jgi:hypothetical protein
MGYCEDSKAYRLYEPLSKKIIKSRDVYFNNEEEIKRIENKPIEGSANIPLEDTLKESIQKDLPQGNEPLSEEDSDNKDTTTPYLRRSTRIKQPPKKYWITDSNQHAEANIAYLEEPQTFQEAISGDNAKEWEEAMKSELGSIEKNQTWTLTILPPGRKAIGSKWVYRLKYNTDGVIERYKARLVAKGYSQKAGIDYTETFAPVSKFASIRLLLAIAAKEDYELHQMDVQSAFLNGDLEEEIYMNQPEGFIEEGKENMF